MKIKSLRLKYLNVMKKMTNEDTMIVQGLMDSTFDNNKWNEILRSNLSDTISDQSTISYKETYEKVCDAYGDMYNLLNDKYEGFVEKRNTLEAFLRLLSEIYPTFNYRLLVKKSDGTIIGACWMSGRMRDAFERFGSNVSADMCHKK